MTAERRKLLFVVNVGWFFLSHRLPLALAAKKSGYDVHVAAALDPLRDDATEDILRSHGLPLHRLRLSRSGSHPIELCRDFFDLLRLFRRLRPDTVHLVTLKPLLLGGLAARIAGVRSTVLAVPGRGSVFSARGPAAAVRRWVALLLYRVAYRCGSTRVIVQNAEDHSYFSSRRVFASDDIRLIRGSGVNITQFSAQSEPDGMPVVLFASRMLKEKGVAEFVEAASLLKKKGVRGRFVLVGEPDQGNPHSHSESELRGWAASGTVEWWGLRSDMNEVFAACHIVCLPTRYGEGVPKVLIEAAASGRPIVTTDAPGCRDIVRHGENGLLIAQRDIQALVAAIERLLADKSLRDSMGRRGRALAEAEFSLDMVVEKTLSIYRELAA
jgi:glycosyltransferase involved in cell wall biosynthesis